MKKQILFLISIVAFIVNGYSQLYTINFENNKQLISIDTSQKGNIWQIGRPQKAFFDSAYSKPNAIVTDTINPYPVNNISSFILTIPGIAVSTIKPEWDQCQVPWVTFYEKYDMDTLKDSGVITLSTDEGKTWVPLNTYCVREVYDKVTGNSSTWHLASIEFYPASGCGVNSFPTCDTALLKFTFYSDGINTNKEGWLIDNITIGYDICEGVPEINNGMAKLSLYPNPSSTQVSLSYQLLQNNKGATLQLYNAVGQLVKTIAIKGYKGEMGEDVSALLNGIYYYTLSVNGVVEATSKLVVIH